jgi:hypothetical protein
MEKAAIEQRDRHKRLYRRSPKFAMNEHESQKKPANESKKRR